MEAPYDTLLVNRLAEIANDSIAQSACPLADATALKQSV